MSIRLYIGNLPQNFDEQELGALLEVWGRNSIQAVLDRETGACRGFGFANIDDEKLADATIAASTARSSAAAPCEWSAPNVATMPPVATAVEELEAMATVSLRWLAKP